MDELDPGYTGNFTAHKVDLKQERIDRLKKYLDTLRYKHGWGVPMDVVDAIRDRIYLIKKGDV